MCPKIRRWWATSSAINSTASSWTGRSDMTASIRKAMASRAEETVDASDSQSNLPATRESNGGTL